MCMMSRTNKTQAHGGKKILKFKKTCFSPIIATKYRVTPEGDSHKIFNGGDIMQKNEIELKYSFRNDKFEKV